ncbi:MAG: hypothetical protein V4712_16740, partial [Pseudomonadota bacterium]
CAQTAHISLHHSSNVKERSFRQKFQGALGSSASSKALSSDFPDRPGCFRCRFFPSPSLFHFGKAVFRPHRQKPQEEKTPKITFSSQTPIILQNLGVGEILTNWPARFAQLS